MIRHIIAALALALLASPFSTVAQTTPAQPERRTISVEGKAEMTLAPDQASITIGVETDGKSIVSIKRDNDSRVRAIMEAVKGLGIPAKDIMTSDLSIQPNYEWDNNKRRFLGYRMRNVVSVTVNDLSKIERVIDASVGEGSNVLENVSFGTKNKVRLQDSLQIVAARNARAKATVLAEAVGATVGSAISISEHQEYSPQPVYLQRAMVADAIGASSTPVSAGEIIIRSSISAVFELK